MLRIWRTALNPRMLKMLLMRWWGMNTAPQVLSLHPPNSCPHLPAEEEDNDNGPAELPYSHGHLCWDCAGVFQHAGEIWSSPSRQRIPPGSSAWCGPRQTASSRDAATEDGTVSLSIPKQCLVDTIKHTQDLVYSLALNKDGSTLAMGSRNIHIWDLSNEKEMQTVTGHVNPVTRLEVLGRDGGVHVVPVGKGAKQCDDLGGE